jgi:hypothetical protein
MTTQTFIETRKKNGHTFRTEYVVTRETLEGVPASMHGHRWYAEYLIGFVTKVTKVTVASKPLSESGAYEATPYVSTYIEIETPFGVGVVDEFRDHSEVDCWVPKLGAPAGPKVLIHGCWKKYGQYRGHVLAYVRGHGLPVTGKRVDHTCPARIYAAAQGKSWGV